MKKQLSDAALVCAFALSFGATHAAPQVAQGLTRLDSVQVAAWREDLAFMAREMERHHRNLYHTVSKSRFDEVVAALHQRIPSLSRHQIIVELARIVALVGDGHTSIAPTRDPKIGFATLPVKLYFFKDGLFVRAAHRSHADLAGARVLRIGRMTSEQAYAKVREIVGQDNAMDALFFAPFLLAMPEVLHALGITDRADQATFVVKGSGGEETITLRPLGPARMMPPDTDVSWWPDSGWTDMRDTSGTPPLWLAVNPTNQFWVRYLSAQRIVYVQYNMVKNKEEETLALFAERLGHLMDSVTVDKVVLDLRLNRGGDGTLNRPLLLTLIKSPKLQGRGKLFTLIGRSTFSAAQFMVNELEQYTEAVFVGEPTGGKANSYGDSRKILLPNSGITVRVSTLWWQEDPRDDRQWKAPDIAADLTSDHYRSNIDPALEAVRAYKAEPSLAQQMAEAMRRGGVQSALRQYQSFRADPRHSYADTEDEVNGFAYQLLDDGRYDAAIPLLQRNAADNPGSANVYDSLGEAYMMAGQKNRAAENFKKSLKLDPRNANARTKLQELGVES
ncbi:MAG TPA: tetratricopeptide repeat protein [Gemmatimonadales bacterium]|nr:tetratricopeptide repeat protein [Gemmatimonadales bacterium]